MKKIIYHGSQIIVEHPEFGKGKKTNDYGRGFYCTENIELAKEWACGNGTDGYANQYELDMLGLRVLDLNSEDYHILNWLALLADNRTYWQKHTIAEEAKDYLKKYFLVDITDYDVIVGYRADDSYFSFAQDFVGGLISLQQLSEAMKIGKLGEQVVLKSKQAFSQIHYLGSELANVDEYYGKKIARDREARREYRETKRKRSNVNDIYMIDIMREGMKNDDTRLF